MKFLKDTDYRGMSGVSIEVRIQPNASKNKVVGSYGAKLKIKIQSPPVDGKANACLINYVSEIFLITKSKIHLLRGEHSREKTLFLEGVSAVQIVSQLEKCCSALN
jgi:hypothetical protein